MSQDVLIYTTQTCPFCVRAKLLLESKGIEYQEISVDGQPELRQMMAAKAGKTSVPQIWVGETHIGGCDDLFDASANGALETMVK